MVANFHSYQSHGPLSSAVQIFTGVVLVAGLVVSQRPLPVPVPVVAPVPVPAPAMSGLLLTPLNFTAPGGQMAATPGMASMALNGTSGQLFFLLGGLPSGTSPVFVGIFPASAPQAFNEPVTVLFNGTTMGPSANLTNGNGMGPMGGMGAGMGGMRVFGGQTTSSPQTVARMLQSPSSFVLRVVAANGSREYTAVGPLSSNVTSARWLPSTSTLNRTSEDGTLSTVFGMPEANMAESNASSPQNASLLPNSSSSAVPLLPGLGRQSVTPSSSSSPPATPLTTPSNSAILSMLSALMRGAIPVPRRSPAAQPPAPFPTAAPLAPPAVGGGARSGDQQRLVSAVAALLGSSAGNTAGVTVNTDQLLQTLISSLAVGGGMGMPGPGSSTSPPVLGSAPPALSGPRV